MGATQAAIGAAVEQAKRREGIETPAHPVPRVLLVERDDPSRLDAGAAFFADRGLEVERTPDLDDALLRLSQGGFGALVIDTAVVDTRSTELVRRCRELDAKLAIVTLTDGADSAVSLLGVGASAVLPRAFATPAVLLATVQRQARATVEGPRAGGDPRRDTGVRVRVNRTESGFPAEEPTSRIKANGAPHAPAEPFVVSATTFELPYPDAKRVLLNGFNKAYVEHKLRSSGSNVSEAARRSGLDRSNFRRLVRGTRKGGGPESEAPDAPDGED